MKLLKLNKKRLLILFFIIAMGSLSYAQDKDLSWEDLSKQYEVPEWFTEARFGIWVHWGAQSVPEYGGGW
ncbi:alpha-L-fucosidase, partial [Formosa algae]